MSFHLYAPYANSLIIDKAIQSKDKSFLLTAVIIFALASISGEIFLALKEVLTTYLECKIALWYRRKIHKKVRNLRDIKNIDVGELISYNTSDLNLIEQKIRFHTENIINSLQIIAIFIFIGYINWKFTPLLILVLPLYGFLPKLLGKKISEKSYEVQVSLETISKDLSNSYNFSKEIRLYNKEHWDFNRVNKTFYKSIKPLVQLEVYRNLYTFGNVIYFIFLCIILYFSSLSVINKEISLGTLVALITYFGYISNPIQGIVYNLGRLKSLEAAEMRLDNFFNKQSFIKGTIKLSDQTPIDISINSLYLVKNNKEILSNVNLYIKSGEFIGIVGESGSGKSSLLNILAKLDYHNNGNVTLQGKCIEDINHQSFYQHVKFVSQEPDFIEGSVKDNLLIDSNDFELANALFKKLGLEFLVDCFDYQLEKNAKNLSGGQRQRLALARALIVNPSILILDEATSALDEYTEQKVMKIIHELRKNKTTILATHNVDNLKDADRTVVFSNGRILETNNHNSEHEQYYLV